MDELVGDYCAEGVTAQLHRDPASEHCLAGGVGGAELVLRRAAPLLAALAALAAAAPAGAQSPPSVLGVSCSEGEGGISVCTGSQAARVASWDGTPLDVDIYLPPADGEADPLIAALHGFGVTKLGAFAGESEYPIRKAREGYAVIAYSARGQGFSCGVVASRTAGCEQGWIHLADARYEVRDTQYLAGLLVDEGLVAPTRIGVTGDSYGGGQSLMLATLRDRMMLPDGELVPFESPGGVPMRIAAAAPRIGWSDLAYALAPTGRKLDYLPANPYGPDVGITKFSYLQALYAAGLPGYYAPPGADPSADIQTWKSALDAGAPYDRGLADRILYEMRRFRSPYSVQDSIPPRRRIAPAPMTIYNGFTDDIMPADQALAYYARAKKRFPKSKIGMVFEAGYGHNRGSLVEDSVLAAEARERLFDRYLMGDRSVDPTDEVVTTTQGCNEAPVLGPFETRTWRAQHPGEVRVRGAEPQVTTSAGGSESNSAAHRPLRGRALPDHRRRGRPRRRDLPRRARGRRGLHAGRLADDRGADRGRRRVRRDLSAALGRRPRRQPDDGPALALPPPRARPPGLPAPPRRLALRRRPRAEARAARPRLPLHAGPDHRVLDLGARPDPGPAGARAPRRPGEALRAAAAMTARRALPLLAALALLPAAVAEAAPRTWFVSAGAANGDGSRVQPFATLGRAERASAPGERIAVLRSTETLDGGIALKRGQRLSASGSRS